MKNIKTIAAIILVIIFGCVLDAFEKDDKIIKQIIKEQDSIREANGGGIGHLPMYPPMYPRK